MFVLVPDTKTDTEKLLDRCKIVLSDEQFISESIGLDYIEKWVPSTPVFISAQTGAGKNTFIEQVLIKQMVPKEYTVLILSNRIALGRQEKTRIAKIMDRIEPKNGRANFYSREVERRNSEMLDVLEDFGSVTIMSYQGFNKSSKEVKRKKFDYVILDECHFFLADAKFNKFTSRTLKNVMEYCSGAIRVYMTATPTDVIMPIIKCEMAHRCKEISTRLETPPGLWGKGWCRFPEEEHMITNYTGAMRECFAGYPAVIYEMERNYDYVQCRYLKAKTTSEELDLLDLDIEDMDSQYSSWEMLASIIKEQIKKEEGKKEIEKWIVFVPSKKIGMWLQESLGNNYACLVTAESKNRTKNASLAIRNAEYEYAQIQEESSFSTKVLICTSVIDNGINIIDPAVKNMAVLVLDKVLFLQMLGRKRRCGDETLNLYIQEYKKNSINYKLQEADGVNQSLERITRYKGKIEAKKELFDEIFDKDRLFYYAGADYEGLAYNEFAEEKLKCEKEFYEKLLDTEGEKEKCDSSYDEYVQKLQGKCWFENQEQEFGKRTILEQLSWLGLEHTFEPQNYVAVVGAEALAKRRENAEAELLKLLEEKCVVGDLGENEEEAFATYGMALEAQEEFSKQFKDLSIRAFGRREKDRTPKRPYKNIAICDVLRENDLPYELLSRTVTDTNGKRGKMWVLLKKKSLNPE